MNELTLQNLQGCLSELENCSRGLTYSDHIFSLVLDAIDETAETWATYEAEGREAVRTDYPKATTAGEKDAALHEWVLRHPSARKARDAHQEAVRRKSKVERFMRTMEKRIGSAQSAQNVHDRIARHGGQP